MLKMGIQPEHPGEILKKTYRALTWLDNYRDSESIRHILKKPVSLLANYQNEFTRTSI